MATPEPNISELALAAPAGLEPFNRAGVLNAADVHVAVVLCQLAGSTEPELLLAAALAVRAPRLGHVFVDLHTIAATASADGEEVDTSQLPWPPAQNWAAQLAAATSLVAPPSPAGYGNGEPRPLRLHGSRLYLDRYWRQEQQLAASLLALSQLRGDIGPLPQLSRNLRELFPGEDDQLQRAAAATGVMRNLTVIAGGPGTGKTMTIARLVKLLRDRAAQRGDPQPLIALCAPTGKAAARMQEAVGSGMSASTIHKLLGWLPGGRFRHHAGNRLPHDVVIVDETSMVPLTLMGQLVEAVRDGAQLVLVGDPDQLAAIEAGAVLRDIVGPAAEAPVLSAGARSMLALTADPAFHTDDAPTIPDPGAGAANASTFGDGVVVLRRGHRFGAPIGDLADAIRRGNADAALAAMNEPTGAVTLLRAAGDELQRTAAAAYTQVVSAAAAGDAKASITAVGAFRILCAHRRGPFGTGHWNAQVEEWLADAMQGFHPGHGNYVGRPLMVTENDYELQLFNGDTGVVIAAAEGELAVFDNDGPQVAPSRLNATETVFASTVHKAQGSQFERAAVILPEPDSPLLTRELLYTAVTRARSQVMVIGSEAALVAAVQRPLQRATGLRELLWQNQ